MEKGRGEGTWRGDVERRCGEGTGCGEWTGRGEWPWRVAVESGRGEWPWRVAVESGCGEGTWRGDVESGRGEGTWRGDVEPGPSVEPGQRHSRRDRITYTTRARKNYAILNFVELLLHWLNLAIG